MTEKVFKIPFKIHPRVFSALGAGLVTNDVVALIELVKNSYDAYCRNVTIVFDFDDQKKPFIEITDDGQGMSRDIIEDVWCMVATPFKEFNRYSKLGKGKRRVAGEKGLGRLSIAKLGDRLEMLTQASDCPCFEVSVNWNALSNNSNIQESYVSCREIIGQSPFKRSGTILRIFDLKEEWHDGKIDELKDNLGRLISPFHEINDFQIYVSKGRKHEADLVEIVSEKFLNSPKYLIKGNVDSDGSIDAVYKFNSIESDEKRKLKVRDTWAQVVSDSNIKGRLNPDEYHCGSFDFEIRGWDIGSQDTSEVSDKFNISKSIVRKAISAHKGISVYRDGILVLPKSENSKDWLGLDLQRVSKVGERMSTSQLVGYVAISNQNNPGLLDTSDRERLIHNIQSSEFHVILNYIVGLLEINRTMDRKKRKAERSINKLFASLSADEQLDEAIAMSEEGYGPSDTVPILKSIKANLTATKKEIEDRFIYYSHMATIGTIAHMIVHEIRNRTTSFGSFLDKVKERYSPFNNSDMDNSYKRADNSITALERFADNFLPLASRSNRKRIRNSILEERILECIGLYSKDISQNHIDVKSPNSKTSVAVDPGELDIILINLLTNAIYWVIQSEKDARKIEIKVVSISNKKRIQIWFDDSGPGIDKKDAEDIFIPGVTKRPHGIGMGLTVASELVSSYGGIMKVTSPGKLGGAVFTFDLPVAK
ncbi:sensor histidine kinase [Leptospira santarosai]|uniref:sensor histidine kinase n=1 Tax=Leptospira santarosai TaxID=28183 RepID=UPI0024AF2CEB|nr:sensor histidine kinase [Leptospira santarosai]MDI7229968.1 sensor histidine kinase [Leptospira santarosai]